jgi:hypothetical protein
LSIHEDKVSQEAVIRRMVDIVYENRWTPVTLLFYELSSMISEIWGRESIPFGKLPSVRLENIR